MSRYLVQRCGATIAVMFVASFVVFVALSLVPGDPAVLILGYEATPDRVAELRRELGLDQPLWKQYVDFVTAALRGDLGRSYQYGQPVVTELVRAFLVTVQLSSCAMAIATIFGVGLGVASAIKVNSSFDHVLRLTLLTSTSIPTYLVGLLLLYLLSVNGPNLPAFGWGTPMHLVLPAITLATYPIALIGRLTRSAVLDVMTQDYLNTARAKGLRESLVVIRHAMPNAAIPIVTVIGLQFGVLLAGAILTESIFSIPGMGLLLLNSILSRDYALIRGAVLLAAVVIALLNLAVDVLYSVIDPRIRVS